MIKRARDNQGSVTIEATIALTAFMFTIVTILTIVNISILQSKMAFAINATAKEISQYSYLYSLTGLNQREGEIYQSGKNGTKPVEDLLGDLNDAYSEIEKLGSTGKTNINDIDDILSAWDNVSGTVQDGVKTGKAVYNDIEKIAENPKNLLFGIVKLAGTHVFDYAKSHLIAAPLSRVMCKKHLVNKKGGSVDSYLASLGVMPKGNSYLDGLDFSQSLLFPEGSSLIRVTVSYDAKLIALLPIDIKFHFCQSATTYGWMAGDVSFERMDTYKNNDTIWINKNVEDRADYIRHDQIEKMKANGYSQTAGLTDVQLYNQDENQFVMIASMNPLWTAEGEPIKTMDDLSKTAIQNQINHLTGKMKSTTEKVEPEVTLRERVNGAVKDTKVPCSGASNKIILVVPTDDGLADYVKEIVSEMDTYGVEVEIVADYGNGARATKVENKKSEEE